MDKGSPGENLFDKRVSDLYNNHRFDIDRDIPDIPRGLRLFLLITPDT